MPSEPNSSERWEVIVVGAGAAGLLAAAHAAERGRRTLLLEKNRRPGVKILMSGGTRCNLTHATDAAGIVQAYGLPGRFLHSALAALDPPRLVELFEAEGVLTKIESTGKIFPASDRAADVLAALLARLQRSGCTLATEEPLKSIERIEGGFRLTTARRELRAEKVIVTTGGKSYPGSGTTGDGYAWCMSLGHSLVPPRPSLTPVRCEAHWVAALRGVTLPDIALELHEANESGRRAKPLARTRGSLLFAHFGLTGPVALDISREVSGHPRPRTLRLECDLLPDVPRAQFEEDLRRATAESGKKQVVTLLGEWLPNRVAETVMMQAEVPLERRAAEISKTERARLVENVKRLVFPVAGTLGFEKAEVTAGGIPLGEVDSRTLQSKLVPGLYLAGEVLDLDGPIGGYNFQAAFSTGWLAAESV
ncbi:MAG: NAD(P)/FAD-dependent oxidoreductase [Pirellulales bacterium]|nr:NAD(P)/FAD-dependent oxidoreductase [Pirellulales bacterium]